MRTVRKLWFVGIGSLFVLPVAACRATVAGDPNRPIKIEAHIMLDIREVKETATSIEDMVSGKGSKAAQKPSSRLGDWLAPPSAWADAPQLKFMTPEVNQAVDSRKKRFDQLKSCKAKGLIGEDREGHVSALGGDGQVQALVGAENQDRETIYKVIVEQNNLGPDAIGTIRATFAEVQKEKAEPGEKIQMSSGEWTVK